MLLSPTPYTAFKTEQEKMTCTVTLLGTELLYASTRNYQAEKANKFAYSSFLPSSLTL